MKGDDRAQVELQFEQTKRRRRKRRLSDTSLAARAHASTTRTEELRAEILTVLAAAARDPQRAGATADEVHQALATTEYQQNDYRRVMEIRRRLSDLHGKRFNQIEDTGIRRPNDAGNPMIVWRPRLGAQSGE